MQRRSEDPPEKQVQFQQPLPWDYHIPAQQRAGLSIDRQLGAYLGRQPIKQ